MYNHIPLPKYCFKIPSTTHLFFNIEPKKDSKSLEFQIKKNDEIELEITKEKEDWVLLQVVVKNRKKNSTILGWLCLEKLNMQARDLVKFMAQVSDIKEIEVV